MTNDNTTPDRHVAEPGATERKAWIVIAAAAVAVGIAFRLIGFSTWPLATDEYYVFRSMSYVLQNGLPEFPCGGYYTRGLLYQYLTAPLLAAGITPEAALRSIAIGANLLMLPAAYLLGRRIGGFRIAILVLIVLALSIWEIEMARFGRMYAPFQALFVWYTYHAYCLIESGDLRRWRWLLGLSLAAPLVWEGGITLPLLNFVPMLMHRPLWQPRHLLLAIAIFAGALVFLQTGFRYLGAATALPPDATEAAALAGSGLQDGIALLGLQVIGSIALAATFLVLGALLIFGVVRSRVVQNGDFRALATILTLIVCVAINQLLLAGLALTGASLVGWFRWQETLLPRYRYLFLALLAISILWIAIAVGLPEGQFSLTGLKSLMSFPELLYSFLYPWLSSMPLLTLVLLAGNGLALFLAIFLLRYSQPEFRFVLVAVILSVVVIGAAQTMYAETRYSFHVFPLMIILALAGFSGALGALGGKTALLSRWVPVVFLSLFALSSEFAVSHMTQISSYAANFRVGYDTSTTRHYYPRFDFRSPAEFVNSIVAPDDIVVITNVVTSQYLDSVDYAYLNETDGRYRGQACNFGRTERWTGLPLLDTHNDLEVLMVANPDAQVWLIADEQTVQNSLAADYLVVDLGFAQMFVSEDQRFTVYRGALQPGASPAIN